MRVLLMTLCLVSAAGIWFRPQLERAISMFPNRPLVPVVNSCVTFAHRDGADLRVEVRSGPSPLAESNPLIAVFTLPPGSVYRLPRAGAFLWYRKRTLASEVSGWETWTQCGNDGMNVVEL